jgi:hypothetical protein
VAAAGAKVGLARPGRPLAAIACLVALTACATSLPSPQASWLTVRPDDPDLALTLRRITLSALDPSRKATAARTVWRLLECQRSVTGYEKALAAVNAGNEALGRRYSLWNGVIGTVGSGAAVAVLVTPVALVAPAAAFVWNVFGVTTEKTEVEPTVAQGTAALRRARELRLRSGDARELFEAIIVFPHDTPPTELQTRKAAELFDLWERRASTLVAAFAAADACAPAVR